jgi:predicted dehydrogenase
MTEAVKWGIIGNANIGRLCVIPAIQNSGNGRLRALATRSASRSQAIITKFDIPCVYENYDDALNDPEIDAVYIPLPNHLHRDWTLKAVAAGKHVLCEKPLACNASEAQEMAEAASAGNVLLMEAFMYRFHPRNRRVKQMVDDGKLGAPRLIRVAFCYRMKPDDWHDSENPRLNKHTGGGALLDVGCYAVSVARWFYEEEPSHVQAEAVYLPNGVDIHVVGSLRFAEGKLATLEASFISALQQTYTVAGENRVVELPHDAFIPWEKDTAYFVRDQDDETGKSYLVAGADEYRLMVEHFADAVLGKRSLPYAPEESVRNMRVLDALALAARTGERVKID